MDFFINTFLCTNKLGQEAKEEGEDDEYVGGGGQGQAAAAVGKKDEQVALNKKEEEEENVKKSPKRHQESKADGKRVNDGAKAINGAEKRLKPKDAAHLKPHQMTHKQYVNFMKSLPDKKQAEQFAAQTERASRIGLLQKGLAAKDETKEVEINDDKKADDGSLHVANELHKSIEKDNSPLKEIMKTTKSGKNFAEKMQPGSDYPKINGDIRALKIDPGKLDDHKVDGADDHHEFSPARDQLHGSSLLRQANDFNTDLKLSSSTSYQNNQPKDAKGIKDEPIIRPKESTREYPPNIKSHSQRPKADHEPKSDISVQSGSLEDAVNRIKRGNIEEPSENSQSASQRESSTMLLTTNSDRLDENDKNHLDAQQQQQQPLVIDLQLKQIVGKNMQNNTDYLFGILNADIRSNNIYIEPGRAERQQHYNDTTQEGSNQKKPTKILYENPFIESTTKFKIPTGVKLNFPTSQNLHLYCIRCGNAQ